MSASAAVEQWKVDEFADLPFWEQPSDVGVPPKRVKQPRMDLQKLAAHPIWKWLFRRWLILYGMSLLLWSFVWPSPVSVGIAIICLAVLSIVILANSIGLWIKSFDKDLSTEVFFIPFFVAGIVIAFGLWNQFAFHEVLRPNDQTVEVTWWIRIGSALIGGFILLAYLSPLGALWIPRKKRKLLNPYLNISVDSRVAHIFCLLAFWAPAFRLGLEQAMAKAANEQAREKEFENFQKQHDEMLAKQRDHDPQEEIQKQIEEIGRGMHPGHPHLGRQPNRNFPRAEIIRPGNGLAKKNPVEVPPAEPVLPEKKVMKLLPEQEPAKQELKFQPGQKVRVEWAERKFDAVVVEQVAAHLVRVRALEVKKGDPDGYFRQYSVPFSAILEDTAPTEKPPE